MNILTETIGDVTQKISTGKTPPTKEEKYFDGEIDWFTPGDFTKNILTDSKRKISQIAVDDKKATIFPENSVLISCIGDIGKVGLVKKPSSANQQITAITLDPKIDPLFFTLWCKSHKKSFELKSKSAVVPILNNAALRTVQFNYPNNLDDQKRIAHLLGKVEGMIARRKQHLQQLDELLKSVFLEMFGDHFVQESHKSFGEYIDVLTDYHANGSYEILRDHVELQTTPNFALMVRTTDLENNNFDNGCNYITEEAYEFLSKSKVYGGEIIINKIGSAGRVYLMPFLNRPVSLGMNAFLLRFNEDLNNIYAYHLLTSDFGTKAIQKHVKGAVTKTITKNAIRSIKIPVPPITLQKQFASIVEKVESLKSRYQSSLSNLENLYGVLSQKAFKGELDLSRVPMEEETR